MRYVGIDYGSAKVGIARSDERGVLAFPEAVIPNNDTLVERIAAIAKELGAGELVVGDTRGLSGAENDITSGLKDFVEELKGRVSIPVVFSPEFFTTREAGRYLKRDGDKDAAAAALILQRYLDSQKEKENG